LVLNIATHSFRNLRHPEKPAQAKFDNFFERATPGLNGILVAADVGPKPEALGAFVTQPLTLLTSESHTEELFYMQIFESPLEDANRASG
jgi:hypothetical protein